MTDPVVGAGAGVSQREDAVLRILVGIQKQLATLDQRVADVQEDQKSMREQVDVCVMTSLRLERAMTSLRQDVRALRGRVDGLEVAK